MTDGKTPKRPKPPDAAQSGKTDKRSSLERLTDFTRRIVSVPKAEVKARRDKK